MKRDKYIVIQKAITTVGDTGGSRSTWTTHWQGWAKVEEMTYSTAMEESQWTGNKAIRVNLRKFPVTDLINSTMRISYRGILYLINSKIELDRFNYEIMASTKETNASINIQDEQINNMDSSLDTIL